MKSENEKRARRAKAAAARAALSPATTKAQRDAAIRDALGKASPALIAMVRRAVEASK
jgi:hypothetical protein